MNNFEFEHNDMVDIRDLIAQIEDIETVIDEMGPDDPPLDEDTFTLYSDLLSIMAELKGMGGDEQWRGDWYPINLIHQSYFTEYAMDLLRDIGDLSNGIPWYVVIDEDATAKNIMVDYSGIEIDGQYYYYR